MPIGKSLRFEVFARDSFTCQYCGRRPPDVILEVDHIHPRSKGGDDDHVNLVTSCYDCNRGKRDKVLSEIPNSPDADLMFLRAQQEIVEAKRYLKAKQKRDAVMAKLYPAMAVLWDENLTTEHVPAESQFRVWLERYGLDEIEYAIYASTAKFQDGQFGQKENYYACLNLIKYISAILRDRKADRDGVSK